MWPHSLGKYTHIAVSALLTIIPQRHRGCPRGSVFWRILGMLRISHLLKSSCTNHSNAQTSDELWEQLRSAGESEYDRFWRMPLEDDYGPLIHSSNADLCNVRPIHSVYITLMANAPLCTDGWQTGGKLHGCVVLEGVR
jgi:Cytosol aminopeptidase family, catalytic domain